MKKSVYREASLDLYCASLNALACMIEYLPDSPTKKIREGNGRSVLNFNLKTIADSIDTMLYRYDQLQRSLGLPDDEDGRYAAVLNSCRKRQKAK